MVAVICDAHSDDVHSIDVHLLQKQLVVIGAFLTNYRE